MTETTLQKELKQFILERGIEDTNFFNGRILTAGDLQKMQEASRQRDRQHGLALGAGIAHGLEVRLLSNGTDARPPVLAVSKGLAINRQGQALALPQNVDVFLEKELPDNPPTAATAFDVCSPIQQNGQPLPGLGIYIFVARPVSHHRGLAPRRGFGQAAKVEGCDRDLLVEGLQFRLVPFDINTLDNLSGDTRTELIDLLDEVETSESAGLAARSKLRNWLAHACFGTEELAAWPVNPYAREADEFFGQDRRSPFHSYGLVDKLNDQGLIDDCDVPLALVCWTETGVKWVDMWSVRRRLSSLTSSTPWPTILSSRRQAEAEANFLQFEDSLLPILEETLLPETIKAADYFRWLPPAGLLPVRAAGSLSGFSSTLFFDALGSPGWPYTDGALLRSLLLQAQYYGPIDLSGTTRIQRYRVYENKVALDKGEVSQLLLVFAGSTLPFIGVAHFGYDNWDQNKFVGQVI